MRNIAIIPARGGSKGIPRKNLIDLDGTPLLEWTINFALKEQAFDEVIISTDSAIIAENVLGDRNASIPFESMHEGDCKKVRSNLSIHRRQLMHSGSAAKTSDTVVQISIDFGLRLNDTIFLLQPTSPFRVPGEIQALHEKLSECKSVISVKKIDSPHPQKTFQLDGKGHFLRSDDLANLEKPRQQLGEFFAPDGAYYVTNVEELRRKKTFFNLDTGTLLRSGINTINLDSMEDLEIARTYAPKHRELLGD